MFCKLEYYNKVITVVRFFLKIPSKMKIKYIITNKCLCVPMYLINQNELKEQE
jgi:hypothetical protein